MGGFHCNESGRVWSDIPDKKDEIRLAAAGVVSEFKELWKWIPILL